MDRSTRCTGPFLACLMTGFQDLQRFPESATAVISALKHGPQRLQRTPIQGQIWRWSLTNDCDTRWSPHWSNRSPQTPTGEGFPTLEVEEVGTQGTLDHFSQKRPGDRRLRVTEPGDCPTLNCEGCFSYVWILLDRQRQGAVRESLAGRPRPTAPLAA